MITVMIYKHDRNDILIGDFQDPKFKLPVSAVAMGQRIIIYPNRHIKQGISIFYLEHDIPEVMDILWAVSKFTGCDVQAEYNGAIIMIKKYEDYPRGNSSIMWRQDNGNGRYRG